MRMEPNSLAGQLREMDRKLSTLLKSDAMAARMERASRAEAEREAERKRALKNQARSRTAERVLKKYT